jgi:hypothetical protein
MRNKREKATKLRTSAAGRGGVCGEPWHSQILDCWPSAHCGGHARWSRRPLRSLNAGSVSTRPDFHVCFLIFLVSHIFEVQLFGLSSQRRCKFAFRFFALDFSLENVRVDSGSIRVFFNVWRATGVSIVCVASGSHCCFVYVLFPSSPYDQAAEFVVFPHSSIRIGAGTWHASGLW